MLLFRRPPEHPDFAAHVADARKTVDEAVRKGKKPEFEELWKREKYTRPFYKAQHGKCGYCEVKFAGQVPQVDHFRPKGAIWALLDDPAAWGQEIEDGTNFHGREREELASRGYYWLAYSWGNYVLSCERCNTACKRSYFPLTPSPDRRLPPEPGDEAQERSLLINPFDGPDPAEHLEFKVSGIVDPRGESRHGFETIRTYGLYRPSLVNVRAPIATRAHDLIQRIVSSRDDERKNEAFGDLEKLGRLDGAHAGMVRIMFEQATEGVRWVELFGEDDDATDAIERSR